MLGLDTPSYCRVFAHKIHHNFCACVCFAACPSNTETHAHTQHTQFAWPPPSLAFVHLHYVHISPICYQIPNQPATLATANWRTTLAHRVNGMSPQNASACTFLKTIPTPECHPHCVRYPEYNAWPRVPYMWMRTPEAPLLFALYIGYEDTEAEGERKRAHGNMVVLVVMVVPHYHAAMSRDEKKLETKTYEECPLVLYQVWVLKVRRFCCRFVIFW